MTTSTRSGIAAIVCFAGFLIAAGVLLVKPETGAIAVAAATLCIIGAFVGTAHYITGDDA